MRGNWDNSMWGNFRIIWEVTEIVVCEVTLG